jgi:hypothetical protein
VEISRVQVEKTDFVDAGEQDESGLYDYYYSGKTYVIREGQEEFYARTYDDTPGQVSFLSRGKSGNRNPFREVPYADPIFCRAVQFLIETEHMSTVSVLTSNQKTGYETVDLARIRQTK